MRMKIMSDSYLDSDCAMNDTLCTGCHESVKESPDGRFYITMGHAGFNTAANNRNGYATKNKAISVMVKLLRS